MNSTQTELRFLKIACLVILSQVSPLQGCAFGQLDSDCEHPPAERLGEKTFVEWREGLSSSSHIVRLVTVAKLDVEGPHRADFVPLLLRLLDCNSRTTQHAIRATARCLAQNGTTVTHPAAETRLLQIALDSQHRLQVAALRALAISPSDRTIGLVGQFRRLMQLEDSRRRLAAAQLVLRITKDTASTVPTMLAAYDRLKGCPRRILVMEYARFAKLSPQYLTQLDQYIQDNNIKEHFDLVKKIERELPRVH